MGNYELKAAIAKIENKRLNFGLYKGAKSNGVLITPRPASTKLIEELETDCGKAKRVLKGLCFWENDRLIFATKSEPSASWESMITKVFKDHECSKYLPITLRQLKEDEADEAEGEEGVAPTTGAIPPPPSSSPPQEASTPAAPAAEAGEAQKAFAARLQALLPKVKEAIAAGNDTVKLLASEAALSARKQDFAQANLLLDQVEAKLAGPHAAEPPPAPSPAAAAAATEIRAGTVDYLKCRLAWEAAKKKIQSDLQQLEKAILSEFKEAPAYGELAQKVRKFDTVLASFAEDLGTLLDASQNSADPAVRAANHQKAGALVQEFRTRANEPFLASLDENPFVPVGIQRTLVTTLDALSKRLV
jgi:hypothetical protein